MFNEEYKLTYLSILNESTSRSMRFIFNMSEVMETLLNKDLYDFSMTDFYNLFKENNWFFSFPVYKSRIKKYIIYSYTKGYGMNNNTLENLVALTYNKSTTNEEKMATTFFGSPADLREALNNFLTTSNELNRLFYMCHFELVYMGIVECSKVEKPNINIEEKSIVVDDVKYTISDEFLYDIKEYMDMEECKVHSNPIQKRKLAQTNKFFRLTAHNENLNMTDEQINKTISKIYSKEKEHIEEDIEVIVECPRFVKTNIKKSGLFDKVYRYIKENDVSTYKALSAFGLDPVYNSRIYELWKETFRS